MVAGDRREGGATLMSVTKQVNDRLKFQKEVNVCTSPLALTSNVGGTIYRDIVSCLKNHCGAISCIPESLLPCTLNLPPRGSILKSPTAL